MIHLIFENEKDILWVKKYLLKCFMLNTLVSCTVFLIISYTPIFLLEIRGSSKFRPMLGTHWFVMNLNKNEAFFFLKKKIKMADSKKLSFSTAPKSWEIVNKISRIGPWVSRIDWCKGHQCNSIYMAFRLFLLHSYSNSSQINGYKGWEEIWWLPWFPAKR